MNTKLLRSSLVFFSGLFFVTTLFAQAPQFPAPSPASTLKQRVGLTDVEIVYSRPSAKDRAVFGGLVPYGQVWRTGANSPTKITFSTAVKLNGAEIPAGTYALLTIPGESEWTIIISSNLTQAAAQYDGKADVARVKATPVKLAQPIETFTIEINHLRDDSAILNISWEKTSVPVKLQLNLTSKLVAQIEAVMAAPEGTKPYYQAAMFYYDNGQDLQKAGKWVDAAIAAREAHYIVHLKARILAKLGDKAGAAATAKRSSELAITAKETGYVKLNDDLVASLK